MWRLQFVAYAVRWHIEALWLRVAVRVWLNRAWMRNGNCLVVDLEKIENHMWRHGGSMALEPPYDYDQSLADALDAMEDDEDDE